MMMHRVIRPSSRAVVPCRWPNTCRTRSAAWVCIARRRESSAAERDATPPAASSRPLSKALPPHLARLAWPERERLAGESRCSRGTRRSRSRSARRRPVMDSCLAGPPAGSVDAGLGQARCSCSSARSPRWSRGAAACSQSRASASPRASAAAAFGALLSCAQPAPTMAARASSRAGSSDCASLQSSSRPTRSAARSSTRRRRRGRHALVSAPPLLRFRPAFPRPCFRLASWASACASGSAVQDALADAGAEAERALGNVRTVKLFACEATRPAATPPRSSRAAHARRWARPPRSRAGAGLALQASVLVVLALGGQRSSTAR